LILVKMKIAIDLDDVVVDFVNGFLKTYELIYGKKFPFEKIISYNFCKCLKIPKEEAYGLVNRFYETDYFKNIVFIKGAKEGIHKLAKKGQIYFVTARPLKIKDKTRVFIEEHFPNIFLEIIHSGDLFSNQGPTKATICKKKNIEFLIDDNKNYAIECASNGTKVLLFDKPWNKDLDNDKNIYRVYNWREVLDIINLG